MADSFEEQFKDFAEAYRDTAHDLDFLRQWSPLNLRISMPHRSCEILDKEGKTLAYMHSDIDLGPAIAVVPHLIGFARIFVDAANAVLAKKEGE